MLLIGLSVLPSSKMELDEENCVEEESKDSIANGSRVDDQN
jgi:hypothetical protein